MTRTEPLYTDVGKLLDAGDVRPPAPDVGLRSDGIGLFYRGQVNVIFGQPESGKTLAALCAVADELFRDGRAIVIDLDHNGAAATITRLISMGVDDTVLRDPHRFRYCAPEDAEHLGAVVKDATRAHPTVVLVDSIGELLPLLGASSNSPDDFTRVHTAVLKPLAGTGAAVIGIDHLAKGTDSQAFGSTGTAAKKRAIGGTSLRCTVVDAFRPGHGGKAALAVNKDRHGGLRAMCPTDEREPLAAMFTLSNDERGDLRWQFLPPTPGQRAPTRAVPEADVQALTDLVPPPSSQRDVKARLGWGSTRSMEALAAWRTAGAPTVLPAPTPPTHGSREQPVTLRERSGSTHLVARSVLPAPQPQGVGAREHPAAIAFDPFAEPFPSTNGWPR